MPHTLVENARFTTVASGTFINGNHGGTATSVSAGDYSYHLVAFFGTLANNGTINVYGVTNSGGSAPVVLGSVNVGSANGQGAAFEVKSDTLLNLGSAGTTFTHIAAAGTVESGGTWRGALVIISHMPRSAPPTSGFAAVGSLLF